MTSGKSPTIENIIELMREHVDGEFGIISLNSLFINSQVSEITDFISRNGIEIPEGFLTTLDYIKHICLHFYRQYEEMPGLKDNYPNPLIYMAHEVLQDEIYGDKLYFLDFISKSELISVFADYCADMGITVYNAGEVEEYGLDLYLTKKTPFLKTESVFVRTAAEMTSEKYEHTLGLIQKAGEIAIWSVVVTTPLGVLKIGLDRIVADMDTLNVWLYVIDPTRKRVFGITGGKGKTENYEKQFRDNYIQKLPHDALRAPSKLKLLSDYVFKEDESYKSERFDMFEVLSEIEHNKILATRTVAPKYKDIFKNLIIIDQESGIPLLTYDTTGEKEQIMFSGFLSAMDEFVQSISGGSSMKEINYKGFFVNAAYGDYIKLALFLTKAADKGLKERLEYLVNFLEEKYGDLIIKFRNTGDQNLVEESNLLPFIDQILKL